MVLNGAFIVANTCFILSAGATWGYVFTDDAEVVELVAQAIWMLALYSLFDSYQCIGAGGLRGLGLPSYGAAANLIGWVCVGLPLAWVFAIREGLGLRGIWVGFTAAVAVVSLLCFAVLLLKDWQAIAVASHSQSLMPPPPLLPPPMLEPARRPHPL